MKKLILTARSLAVGQFFLPALALALIGNILLAHQAHATFFAPRGQTQIISITGGSDRLTGQPISAANPAGGTSYIYPGDTVGWTARVWNAGDLQGGTDVTVRSNPFTGPDTNTNIVKQHVWFDNQLQYEPIIIGCTAVPIGCGYYFLSDTKNYSWQPQAVKMDMTGSSTPGNRYCEYVSVNPAGINFIPGVGASSLIPGIPPWWPYTDWRNSNFTSGTWVGPLGPTVPGDAEGCAEVAYNYNLVPSITGVTRAAGGGTDTLMTNQQNQVQAGTPATISQLSQWQVTQVVLAPGANPSAANLSTQQPCDDKGAGVYKKAGVILFCKPVAHSGSNPADPVGVTFDANGRWSSDRKGGTSPNGASGLSVSTAGLPAGQICYVYSISSYKPVYGSLPNPSSSSSYVKVATWSNSVMVCPANSTPPIHPKVQILGDDLRAGGQIITSQADGGLATTFGSWATYASYAGGKTGLFATASGLKDGKPSDGLDQNTINSLTFANTQTAFGSFASASTILGNAGRIQGYFDALKQSSPSLTAGSSQNLDNLAGRATPYFVDGKLTIQSSTIAKGKTLIIVASDTVTIAGDVRYATDPLGNLGDIPQLVIVAPRITIDEGVGQVDAWLMTDLTYDSATTPSKDAAKFYINTCTAGGAPTQSLNTGMCHDPLTVNGPVITSHLYLNRTSGDDTSDSAAETFVNDGTAYLWALNYASNNLGLATTRQVELPPRY